MPDGRKPRADAMRNRQRVLDAAEEVFARKGPSASTEEVARAAGVGVGTVFRHFPAKDDLLRAILDKRLEQMVEHAGNLAESGDAASALFAFFTDMVDQAAKKKSIVDLLAASIPNASTKKPLVDLEREVDRLLDRAKDAGVVRLDVGSAEVMALLEGICRGTVEGGWSKDLRTRTLDIIFAGLGPA